MTRCLSTPSDQSKTAMKRAIKNIVEHSTRSEKSLERYLTEHVAAMGGVCLKYYNPNVAGYPDRVILMPGGSTTWVELKGAEGRLSELQRYRVKKLREMGHAVNVCGTLEDINVLLYYLNEGL